ncbi:unnamed protein product [Paramecium sonneborni]|uniref:Transmembrane protein n=1 Tax=Paramecium sonneborni TaxID=65129 RepID=A0A8S1N364_9CILI|nr:unnamed protein product [Paramecium sonneborni]
MEMRDNIKHLSLLLILLHSLLQSKILLSFIKTKILNQSTQNLSRSNNQLKQSNQQILKSLFHNSCNFLKEQTNKNQIMIINCIINYVITL